MDTDDRALKEEHPRRMCKSFGPFHEHEQLRELRINRVQDWREQLSNPDLPGRWLVKCMCVCFIQAAQKRNYFNLFYRLFCKHYFLVMCPFAYNVLDTGWTKVHLIAVKMQSH